MTDLELAAWEAIRAWELLDRPMPGGPDALQQMARRRERLATAMRHLKDVSDYERKVGMLKPKRNRRLEEIEARRQETG